MLLKNKTALITGCNRGIGKAIMTCFARNGADIWACVRKADDAFSHNINRLAEEHGVQITPLYFELTDDEQMKEAFKTVRASKKNVDVLVNNAAVIDVSLFQMTSIDDMRTMFDVNFFAQMKLTQYITRIMVRNGGGSIINLSSSAAIEANAGRCSYAASKAALLTATQVMAKELAGNNIRANVIAPGLTQTDMMQGSTPSAVLEQTLQRISMKRVGQPTEIANVALFLASDQSSYLTGQVIRVDGGM